MPPPPHSIDLFTYALSPFGMKVYWALVYKNVPFALHYVDPRDQNEIAFTGQSVVPVLRVDGEWQMDSGPLCVWLDALFPEPCFAGASDKERAAVLAADEWVTHNLIGLVFRAAIDPETSRSAFRDGRKLAQVMRQTSGGVPWIAQFFWSRLLRRAQFIQRAAAMTDQSKSVAQVKQDIIAAFDERISATGFLAKTDAPSFADLAAFAQLAAAADLGFEGGLNPSSSESIDRWFRRMVRYLPQTPDPPLIAGRPPVTRRFVT